MAESGTPGQPARDPDHRPGPERPPSTERSAANPPVPAGPADTARPHGPAYPPPDDHRSQDLWTELMRLADDVARGKVVGAVVPAWRRRTRGERRWPVTA
ncbi:MAG TPA: hypothetical protein VMF87_23695, partial [Streptosporangiaceae bacterium]|nr:hypothetical protein [Streptosporangiaceae bacterium]